MRQCKYCGIFQELGHFRVRTLKGKEYTSHKCKTCEQSTQKENTSKDWGRYFIRLLSKRNRRLTLTVQECLEIFDKQKGLCAITGVPLTKLHGHGKIPTNASLDQIVPQGGYTKDNVRIVCTVVNLMRLDNTDEQFKWWCDKVINGLNSRSD